MTTLRELLDVLTVFLLAEMAPEFTAADEATAEAGRAVWRRDRDEAIDALDAIESWAYGEERECPVCDGRGENVGPRVPDGEYDLVTCPSCHGTGKVKEPGLVERVMRQTDEQMTLEQAYLALVAALRQELGG